MYGQPHFNNRGFKCVLFLAVFAVCWYLGRIFKFDVAYFQGLLAEYPLMLSGIVFILLYVGATTFIWFGPKDVLRIAAAIFFGPYVSTLLVWVGEMGNAAVMFHVSRSLGQEYVQRKLGVGPNQLNKMKDDSSFLGVIAWRINLLAPFRLMDLAYGLTRISFRKYFGAIVLVSVARIFLQQFILSSIGEVLFEEPFTVVQLMLEYFLEHPNVVLYGTAYILVMIAVSIWAVILRSARRNKGAACHKSGSS